MYTCVKKLLWADHHSNKNKNKIKQPAPQIIKTKKQKLSASTCACYETIPNFILFYPYPISQLHI